VTIHSCSQNGPGFATITGCSTGSDHKMLY
jgi:hypothetical protein